MEDLGSDSHSGQSKMQKKLIITVFLLDVEQLKGLGEASTVRGRQMGSGADLC